MSFQIKLGSVTNAQRAFNLLKKRGYKPLLSRLQNPKAGDGCGYVIKMNADDQNKVLWILQKSGIRVLGVEDL